MIYKTKQNDMLDEICYRHYGHHRGVEAILQHNSQFAEYGVFLPAGLEIELPDLPLVQEKQMVHIWE